MRQSTVSNALRGMGQSLTVRWANDYFESNDDNDDYDCDGDDYDCDYDDNDCDDDDGGDDDGDDGDDEDDGDDGDDDDETLLTFHDLSQKL